MTTTRSGVRIDTDCATANSHIPGPWRLRQAVLRDELGGEPHFARFATADRTIALCVISRAGGTSGPEAALPVNELATALVGRATRQTLERPLRGPVIVLGASHFGGLWRTGDLPDVHRALLHSVAREQGGPEVPGRSVPSRGHRG
ncbi:hypothetical protein SMD44_p10035 (plasmid) [Streptomyces alboflavus]|uniref:Uncharacterized protein n=1 Tax=Streptomyces alboflavus TaxID=67267 RepID=A0A291W3F8_9ACTN|nr:hypothetical protein [Streptomyces alboflavus]ATM24534.1 hypothetical protein SMD44_p10035 [Streptomyces alboflavus]